jgi:hypothetical protein
MNQLFNTVNYFEFQAFEALPRWKPPGLYIAQAGITRHFLETKKPPRHLCARRLLVDSLTYANPRESSVGWSITAVVVSP